MVVLRVQSGSHATSCDCSLLIIQCLGQYIVLWLLLCIIDVDFVMTLQSMMRCP